MTKVKGFGYHHGQVMDVADYVFPSQVCGPNNTCLDTLFVRYGDNVLVKHKRRLFPRCVIWIRQELVNSFQPCSVLVAMI